MKRIVITLCVAAILAATGCGKKSSDKMAESFAEKLIEKGLAAKGVKTKVNLSGETSSFTTTDADGQEHTVKIGAESMSVTGPDGVASFRASGVGHIPEDFPKDVFVFPGATVISSMMFPYGATLTLQSSATLQDITATTRTEMQAKGWTQQSTMDMGEMTMVTFTKDTRTVSLIIRSESDLTTMQITVAMEAE